MRLSRLSVSACAFAAFMLAGLSVGNGQAPAPQTQKPAQPPRPPLLHAGNLIMLPDARDRGQRRPRVRIGELRPASTSRATSSATTTRAARTITRWIAGSPSSRARGTAVPARSSAPKEMKPMPAGSVMFHPAYFIHYDGNQDGGETIVQIQGYGPVTTVQVEEDEKGNPMTKGGEGAGYATTPPAKSRLRLRQEIRWSGVRW